MSSKGLGGTEKRIASLVGGMVAMGALVAVLNMTGTIGTHENGPVKNQSTAASTGERGAIDFAPAPGVSQGPGKPCAAAVHVDDLAQLRTGTSYWPAREQFTDAWTCAAGSPPFIMYGRVQVSYAPGAADDTDPAALVAGLAKEFNEGSVVQIQGRPSWVGTGDAKVGSYTHAFMLVNGTAITLLAPADVSLDDLLRVANDLELPVLKG